MRSPGFDSMCGSPELPVDETEMVTFYCDEVCCTLRPSGTEPKVKYYIEACSQYGLAAAEDIAREFRDSFLSVLGMSIKE